MNERMTLRGQTLRCEIDAALGRVVSLKIDGDPLDTEFAANETNLLYPQMKGNREWLGEWLFRIWDRDAKTWKSERTCISPRSVETDGQCVRVTFSPGKEAESLRRLEVAEVYRMEEDDLVWEMELRNRAEETLDVGEVSMALTTNTDFNSIFEEMYPEIPYHWHGPKQRDWHEKRVFQHLHLAGSNSYAFLQRPRGDFPALLLHPENGTYVDTAYQMVPGLGSHWGLCFEGPYYLALYSKAPRQIFGWLQPNEYSRYWFNGNHSLVLKPGESRSFRFRLSTIRSYAQVSQKLTQDGLMAVHAVPGMTAPLSQPIRFALQVKGGEPKLRPEANNLKIQFEGAEGDTYRYTLTATEPGQKKIHATFAGGETNLLFYIIDEPGELLKKHASFVARRQFYDNPDDQYDRHGLFLPYDDQMNALYLDSEESWQVGGTDEYCFTIAMFLAEKNARFPDPDEIGVLERFVEEGLWRSRVQDPETFEVIRGMYWEENTPADADQGNKWSYESSRSKLRTFNYPLLMDVFFALYQIDKAYGLTKRHTGKEYLTYAYRCALLWHDLGRNKNNGAPAGATITEVLDALREEIPEAYEKLYPLVENCARINSEALYPYGSELYVDQTSHNQVEALMSYFGYEEKKKETWRITKALRAGMQPTWYKNGNEKRGNVCVWYATPLNTRVLYNGFDALGDREMLEWGYAGLTSFLTTLRLNGVAHGWFTWWPDRSYFDMRSLDTDMGMYGYFKSARAYVVKDEIFGWTGYGCLVTEENGALTARLNDGVGRVIAFPTQGVRIEALQEELTCVSVTDDEVRVETRPVFERANRRSVTVSAAGRKVWIDGKPSLDGENLLSDC